MIWIVLVAWMALPIVLWWTCVSAISPQNRPALLLASDAAIVLCAGLGGMIVVALTSVPDPVLSPVADTYYVSVARPGPYEAQAGIVLALLTLVLLFIGHLAPFGAGRVALWLFALIHVAYGLSLVPRIVWRLWGDSGGFPLDIDLAGSQLMVMVFPATTLALVATFARLGWRFWTR